MRERDGAGRVPVVLAATVIAGLVAAALDWAMAGAGLVHTPGLVLAAAIPIGVVQALLAAAAPATPPLREQFRRFAAWFRGDDGAARVLATVCAVGLFALASGWTADWFGARFHHAGLIAAAAGLVILAEAAVCAALLLPLVSVWRMLLRAIGDPSPAAAVLSVGALVLGWSVHVVLAGPPEDAVDLRPVVVVLLFVATQGAAAHVLDRARAAVSLVTVFAGAIAVVLLVPYSATSLAGDAATLAALTERSALSAPVLRALRAASDGDGDGHAALFGGGDCDDSDAETYPGATDPRGDGLDLDCDGAD